MTAARISSVVDVAGAAKDSAGNAIAPKITVAIRPVRSERFTSEQVSSPQVLSDQLTRSNQLALDASQAARANPFASVTIYRGIDCPTGGTKVIIRHGLNKRVVWWVVGWSGAGTVDPPILVSDELDASFGLAVLTDANTLALKSYVDGIVDLAVG